MDVMSCAGGSISNAVETGKMEVVIRVERVQ